jgi:hypothetical protein
MAREMKSSWKLSAHPPSEKGPNTAFFYGFQHAWLDANPGGMIPPDGPRIEPYRPQEIGPGVRRFATIRTSASVLQPGPVTNPKSEIWWFNAPESDKSLDIHLLIVERKEEAAAWCLANIPPDRLQSGIVDESVLGDLLITVAYRRTPPSGVVVSSKGPEYQEAAMSSSAVAIGIESSDRSLLLEQVSVGAHG